MSLTNERLKEICERPLDGIEEREKKLMAKELLQLRELRDAGDEEVDVIVATAMENPSYRQNAVDFLGEIAIARGQTRTDAVNQAAEWAKECEALQERYEDENSERLIVEKERDEVVGLLKWLVRKTRHGNGCHLDALATASSGLGDPARRILEIVEWK